jgi:formylglycine-generating enzyme required for sulfatase activity
MRKIKVLIVFVCVMAAVNIASADTIRGIDINFVTIGNADNTADSGGRGSVAYNYRIGKYEVTNTQWNGFVSLSGGKPTGSDPGYSNDAYFTGAQQPANCISWYEATQFCNYLTSGDKSKGAYQFSGDNTDPCSFLGIDRTAAQTIYGIIYVLPTEDEWYKAAYYKPDASGYSLYANGTSTAPIAGVDTNYDNVIGQPWNIDTGTMEQNGTFNMMGNVWEWDETLVGPEFNLRGLNGGSITYSSAALKSTAVYGASPENDSADFGFRIVSVPEPATIILLSLSSLAIRKFRR